MRKLHLGVKFIYQLRDDDMEVVRYFASLFDDNKSFAIQPRHPGVFKGKTYRISDSAGGLARTILEERGLWVPSDPAYYDHTTGPRGWEGHDNLRSALNTFLLREGIIETAKQPSHRRWSPPEPEVAAATPKRSEWVAASSESGAGDDQTSKVLPWVWVSAIIVLVLSIFQLIRSRRKWP